MIDRRHLHAVTPTADVPRTLEEFQTGIPAGGCAPPVHVGQTVEEQYREDAARIAAVSIVTPYGNSARAMAAEWARARVRRVDEALLAEPALSRARAFGPGSVAAVPGWAHFTAIDGDGALWAYSERPRLEADCWAPWSMSSRIELLGYVEPSSAWRGSLLDLRDYTAGRIVYTEHDDASARTAFLWVLGGIVGLIGLVIGASAAGWLTAGWL
jgi:hypothetical protein